MSIPSVTTAVPMATPPAQDAAQNAATNTRTGSAPVETSARLARPNEIGGGKQPDVETKPVTAADLQQALEDVQNAIGTITNDLRFSIDQDTGRTIVKIVDRETDEVIKQFPSDEMIRIAKALDKLQGLLLQQEA